MQKNSNKKSLFQNWIYSLIQQLLTIALPLITTPYLSRVLGANQIGTYGYTTSIATYFILFGTLGISMYGQREIAYRQDDFNKKSKLFWEMIILRLFSLSISFILYFILFCRINEFSLFYKILLLEIIANYFDINWFFQGIEEFDKTVIRNIIVKILGIICIFIFVKTPNDLPIYLLIYALSVLIGNLSLWFYIPKYVKKVSLKDMKLSKHILPIIILFLPQVAIQVYTVLDKTMIGAITNDMSLVGFYEQAQKIVKTTLCIVGALQLVMNSRIAEAFSKKNNNKIISELEKSFSYVFLLAVPATFGLIAIAHLFVPWFYGDGYNDVINVIKWLSPIVIVIGLSGVTGIQYLVQTKNTKHYAISVFLGCIINMILNFILIRRYALIGAIIASIVAEISVLIYQLIVIRKVYKVTKIIRLSWKYLLSSIIMFLVLSYTNSLVESTMVGTIIQFIIGGSIYFISLIILKETLVFSLINKLKNICKKIIKVKE